MATPGKEFVILDGHEPVYVSYETWSAWHEQGEDVRLVDLTEMHSVGMIRRVLTRLLLAPHRCSVTGDGPFFFGTKVFLGRKWFGPRVSRTWSDAEKVHSEVVASMQAGAAR